MKIEKDGSTGHRVQVMLTPILDDNGKDALGVIYIVASMEDVYKQMKDINQIFATGTVIALLVTRTWDFIGSNNYKTNFRYAETSNRNGKRKLFEKSKSA